jgi:hypothetical protein
VADLRHCGPAEIAGPLYFGRECCQAFAPGRDWAGAQRIPTAVTRSSSDRNADLVVYELKGHERYVRVEIFRYCDRKRAWSQPIFVRGG